MLVDQLVDPLLVLELLLAHHQQPDKTQSTPTLREGEGAFVCGFFCVCANGHVCRHVYVCANLCVSVGQGVSLCMCVSVGVVCVCV